MKRTLLCLVALFSVLISFGQKENAWREVEKPKFGSEGKIRRSSLPIDYKLFEFDYQNFVSSLTNVPKRGQFLGQSNVIVSIPSPTGELVDYRIIEASTFEEALQQQHPDIRSFAGNAVNDPGSVIRFSVSPFNGLNAIVRNSNGSTYVIDPYSMDYKTFIVFDRAKRGDSTGKLVCTTEEAVREFGRNIEGDNTSVLRNADDGLLRVFQMAQSCTGEYANYFGASTAGTAADQAIVLAAFNATYTRCNAIFEMDFNSTMQLIANTTAVIYYNPATDPYSDSSQMGNWNTQLGNTLQSVIGNANYDIGHLFGADGGGGNAGCIGCVCSADNSKGRGITSPADAIPEGDFFDVDYVAHEIGHQMGGNHTFSFSAENNAVNMEPGSGVTIMGYAGITGATDVAAHSIPIFHAGTIQQVTNNIKTKDCGGADSGFCLQTINIGNAVPNPSAPATKTMPIGTAFKLIGTATDADANDILSYCWEQVDDATTVGAAASYPSGTKTNGANFRSYLPKNNGTRYFPRLEDHVANGVAGNQWEIVPTINRTLNFRLTVRDNRPGGGTNESVNTAVTFTTSAGPFLVTSQNTTGINYTQGSTQTVTWSVNNTTSLAGSNNVNIKLSTDGGKTYPITLVANTPNDGTQTVTIPNVSAPFCRILVEPTGNDYYAINTNDFAIGYTVNDVCQTYTRTLTTGNIITAQNPLAYQAWSVNVPDNVIITDVNVSTDITHARRNQLYTAMQSPNGTFVALFQTGGCNNASANLVGTWDDQSATASGSCNFGGGTMQPVGSLATLNGESSLGNWIFAAADVNADTRDGVLNSFTFEICYKELIETPNACGVITTTWNGSSWSNGTPLKNVQAIFDGNYSSTGNIEACSVIVNSGANVVFNANHTLIVTNEITVNGTGALTIENNAGLRQINGESSNTGNVLVKRSSSPMIRLDYTGWSSPVSGQQLQAFSPNTVSTRFYEYLYTGTTTPTAYQSVTATNNFVAGKGYMIRAANNSSSVTPTVHSGQFFGVPFNGDFNVNLGIGYNLLGNPYASPINADRFMFDNETLVGALYFWTNTTPASGGVYPQNNFASYTTLGGTAAFGSAKIPNGAILPGQGFYVRAYDFGSALFSNDQRVNASASTQFFKTSSSSTDVEKHRIWLNLNDDNTSYNQILVGYMNGASNGVDNLIDAKVLDASKPMVYNLLNDEAYVIQGKGLPFDDNDIIPLGLQVLESGNYTLGIEQVDGLFASQEIFLKDNETNIIHDLKQGDYQFTTQSGDYKERFELVFKSGTLSADDVVENTISVYANNSGIQINSSEKLDQIIVFDVLGRKLFEASQIQESNFTIQSILSTNQALIVKVKDVNGNTKTQKIVY